MAILLNLVKTDFVFEIPQITAYILPFGGNSLSMSDVNS